VDIVVPPNGLFLVTFFDFFIFSFPRRRALFRGFRGGRSPTSRTLFLLDFFSPTSTGFFLLQPSHPTPLILSTSALPPLGSRASFWSEDTPPTRIGYHDQRLFFGSPLLPSLRFPPSILEKLVSLAEVCLTHILTLFFFPISIRLLGLAASIRIGASPVNGESR